MTDQLQHCLFCGQAVTLIHVHGHYQCPYCKANALPCCDGDNCNTNLLLHDPARQRIHQPDSVRLADTQSTGNTQKVNQ